MKKVELLAPAGNYQAFLGALHAGADAIYLGGNQFSARAYADNFTKEEICKAIRYAHLYGKKIYLTVNTLIKDREFSSLYEFISPFYEAGLDGAIIQDMGVWQYLKEHFPDISLHASTQMTITGTLGALFLKEQGAARIVPARELSLAEIKALKENTDLELECFIHGAMCYCYSGMCLFSSILGGRSGNRGRCAQPCRLPYRIFDENKNTVSAESFPLSLKDLCTIEYLPKLIEAGIDSFKIEGRMKRPEYAAGVTAIYRKYIDLYYENGSGQYHVDASDMDKLRRLYIRSEIQTGYYERTNGREMITLHKPGYLGSDETLIKDIAKRYLREEEKYPVTMKGTFRVNEPAVLQIEGFGITQTVYGEIVQPAVNRPMKKEDFLKQLRKTGNYGIQIAKEEIEVEEGAFMPVSRLNELRRNALEVFEDKMIEARGLTVRRKLPDKTAEMNTRKIREESDTIPKLHVMVRNHEQLQAVCDYPCDRIYIDSDFYMNDIDQISQYIGNCPNAEIYLALPYVLREKDASYLRRLFSALHERIRGFLVRNPEAFSAVISLANGSAGYDVVTDYGLYCFNEEAAKFWDAYCKESYLPMELNKKECRYMIENSSHKLSMAVYATIPMMISANCLKKTGDICDRNGNNNSLYLIDRYKAKFPVLCNCEHCYNVIYNSVPYSLHQKAEEIQKLGLFAIRLDFVWETERIVKEILDYYMGNKDVFPINDYTTGHYKRGVE